MKKVLSIFCIIIVFLCIYFLQSKFFSWFNIMNIKPNLFIIYLLFIGLYLGKEYGFFLGLIFGLILDMFCSSIIGINAIILGVVGLLAGLLEKNFSRDHKFTFLFITAILTLFGEIIRYLLIILITHGEIEIIPFLKILSIETIYNILIIIILYPLILKSGDKIRKILIENRRQIKYF